MTHTITAPAGTAPTPADDRRDLVILGGGLVGMTLALAAARAGMTCHVVERADPAELTAEGADGRASAISTASWNLLTNIGLAEALAPLGCPIDAIAVTEGMKPGGMTPGRIDFRPGPGDASLGRMFANRDIRLALHAAARDQPAIAWHTGAAPLRRERHAHGVAVVLDSGATLHGSLLVGAEGRRSPTREGAGIALVAWDYRHRAIVAAITHARPHGNTAWEIFYPGGPFALLPLIDDAAGRHRSALVWTVPERDAAGMLALSEAAFTGEVARRMEGLFGAIELSAPRMSWPLGHQHATRLTAPRLALVGDAAHGMHPIAGQGLNLGLRDVGALVEVLSEGLLLGLEPGDAQLLARYERWRALDVFTVMGVMDGIVRLFGVPGRLPSAARRLGMGAVQRMPTLKRLFMNEARGISGRLPALLQG